MTIGLTVLEELGINLYSNVPAVLSEVVANAWDADAENVSITIESAANKIVVEDDGHGMDEPDINTKYLNVGYKRRKVPGEEVTPGLHRPVMGRKGIGKLSLFSIANVINVYTTKGGQRFGFMMAAGKIKQAIEAQQQAQLKGETPIQYHPDELSVSSIEVQRGTRIVLTELKKGVAQAPVALRKRLARRFSVLGSEFRFSINIGGKPVTIEDRDYFHKIQYLWTFGNATSKYQALCKNLALCETRSGSLPNGVGTVTGWIGTAKKSGDLKEEGDSINKIVIMVRGKLAQEDILEDLGETGLYAKYLIGEIQADFLDTDAEEDIATSNRQRIIEVDPRYQALKTFIRYELKAIQSVWTGLRDTMGEEAAVEIPAVKEWYMALPKEYKPAAKRLFGKINQLPIDDERDRRIIIKNSVVAFESLRYKQNLERIDQLQPQDLQALAAIFIGLDDIETTLYGQIVQERVQVINALLEKVDQNARERAIQNHIFDHLWLIDTSWERATTLDVMEQRIITEFGKINADLTADELAARVDIKYRTVVGKHVVVELKRPDRVLTTMELQKQVVKYWGALKKILRDIGHPEEQVEIICVVGKDLQDWSVPGGEKASSDSLRSYDARVVKYDTLIHRAQETYKEYLAKRREVGRLESIIRDIEEWAPQQTAEIIQFLPTHYQLLVNGPLVCIHH